MRFAAEHFSLELSLIDFTASVIFFENWVSLTSLRH